MVAAKDDKDQKEKLVLVNTRLLALVTNHDSIEANPEKLEAAAEVYRDLLNSVSQRVADIAPIGKLLLQALLLL